MMATIELLHQDVLSAKQSLLCVAELHFSITCYASQFNVCCVRRLLWVFACLCVQCVAGPSHLTRPLHICHR